MVRMFITFYIMSLVQISKITCFTTYILISFVFKKGKEKEDLETFLISILFQEILLVVKFSVIKTEDNYEV